MPGVVVTTATRSGPTAPVRAVSGQLFVSGMTERGPVGEAVRLNGMADYERFFGSRVTYGFLHDALKSFFSEGGTRAYVSRVVGTAPTSGNRVLLERSTAGTSVTFNAANPGAWSGNLTVEVQDAVGVTDGSRVRIIVRLNGDIVEDANNLSSIDQIVSYFAASPYVRAVSGGSVLAFPANMPRVTAATALTAGDDKRTTVVNATPYITALSVFNIALGDGSVAIPGFPVSQVGAGIETHCRSNRRIGILAGNRGDSVNSLVTSAGTFNSEYIGIFAPHIIVPDDAGGTRVISPEGYVAAKRNIAHEEVGPWRAPAGRIAVGAHVVGVDQAFSTDEGNTLDAGKVNAIRVISNTVRLYGWRSLSNDTQNYSYLTGRDLLNRLVNESEARLEDFVFSVIDSKGQLLSAINAELVGLVDPIRSAGGLYEFVDGEGNIIDPGYAVDTGSNINTTDSLNNNEVRARLAVRVSPVGALVSLTIVKVGVTAGL